MKTLWADFDLETPTARAINLAYEEDPSVLMVSRAVDRNLNPLCGNDETILATYRLIRALRDGIHQKINLQRLLVNNVREGVTISDKRIKSYWLEGLMTANSGSGFCGNVHKWGAYVDRRNFLSYENMSLNTSDGICLIYKGRPQAILGLMVNFPETLYVKQIQGVRPILLEEDFRTAVRDGEGKKRRKSARGLMPLDWTGCLVDIAEELAKIVGFSEVSIISGRNHTDVINRRMSPERAREIYDGTAARREYHQEERENNLCYSDWYKKVA